MLILLRGNESYVSPKSIKIQARLAPENWPNLPQRERIVSQSPSFGGGRRTVSFRECKWNIGISLLHQETLNSVFKTCVAPSNRIILVKHYLGKFIVHLKDFKIHTSKIYMVTSTLCLCMFIFIFCVRCLIFCQLQVQTKHVSRSSNLPNFFDWGF